MTTINIYEAKTSFSRLIAAAEAGETLVIARNGKPVAQLGPVTRRKEPRRLGDLAHAPLVLAEDFDSWTREDEHGWYDE